MRWGKNTSGSFGETFAIAKSGILLALALIYSDFRSGGTKLAKDRPEVKKPTAHKKPIGEKKDVAETPATKKPTGATGLYMRFVLSLL